MKTLQSWNSLICYDEFNIDAKEFAHNTFIAALLKSIKGRVVIVLWWDGTMLRAIWKHHQENIPFLGLNFWHKWFLLNDTSWTFPEIPEFTQRKYPLLEVRKNWVEIWIAFNDVNIYSPQWKAISLDMDIGLGKISLWWDGAIIASPAGSTGHSKSYGWPILPHKSENIVISPKWNIDPQSPKVIDDQFPIHIKNSWRMYPLWINIDGILSETTQQDEEIRLEIRKSSRNIILLISEKHTINWDNKVLLEQGFNS